MNTNKDWFYDLFNQVYTDPDSLYSVTFDNATDEVFDEQEVKSIPHYGVNINASYVVDDDTCSLGIHVTDSEDMDINVEVEGDDFYNVVYSALSELYEDINNADKAPTEDPYEKELQEIKADLGNLQQRLNALLNS